MIYKKTYIIFLILGIVCLINFVSYSEEISSARYLLIAPGSRPNGMGEAFTGIADDNSAIYWNPAGLATLTKREVSFTHTKGIAMTNLDYLTYIHVLKPNDKSIGINVFYISDTQWRSNENGDFQGEFENTALTIILSYGQHITKKLSSGVNLKILQWKLDDRTVSSIAGDIGFLYCDLIPKLNVGLAVQNIGTKMKFIQDEFSIPMMVNFGIGYKLIKDKLTLSADSNYYVIDKKSSFNLGMEYIIEKVFAVRTGYKYHPDDVVSKHLGGLSLGLGFGIEGYSIDYAFVPYGDLGDMHRISFTVKF